jgi:hypothetical protein
MVSIAFFLRQSKYAAAFEGSVVQYFEPSLTENPVSSQESETESSADECSIDVRLFRLENGAYS